VTTPKSQNPPGRPRCPVRGCPVVYRGGPPRLCPSHQDDGTASVKQPYQDAAAWLGIMAAPGETTTERPGIGD
jgi:hypothetical protein